MNNKTKHIIIYTILIIALITLLVLIARHFTRLNKPIIQGVVESKTYVASSKVAGRIDSLFVNEGDNVTKGELLYTISTPELDAKLRQVEALQSEAEALNKEVDNGARKQQIEAARSMVSMAEAGEELAQNTFERISRLYHSGVVPRQQYDEAKANHEAAISNLQVAKAEYSLIVSGASSEQRAMAASKVREATAAVEELNAYISDRRVVSPISGEISSITSNVGELVGSGFPVVTILDLNDTWASFNIRESDMENIVIGKRLRCRIPALKKDCEFEVYYIASEADFATWTAARERGGFDIRTFEIRARCIDKNLRILPGMSVIINDI